MTAIEFHKGDLPKSVSFDSAVAVDTETMGLKPIRDRLCLIQLSAGDGTVHLVQLNRKNGGATHLKEILSNPEVQKIFHFARFDVAAVRHHLGIYCKSIFCTKIASKLCRTYTDRHGLRDLCKELLDINISKEQQSSDWGADVLTEAQMTYAASDVLYLHALRDKLVEMLIRENRTEISQACFKFLEHRVTLDLDGWSDIDIFEH